MNPDFGPAEFQQEAPGGQPGESCEALSLADPAVQGELPPKHLDAWLDRLVDGEVAEPERRALLSRLEQAPAGWRRCALAFLEAQAWREALEPAAIHGGSVEESGAESNPSRDTSPQAASGNTARSEEHTSEL